MKLHLIFRSPEGERVVRLEAPVVVGRDEGCEVRIDSVRLSRRHAEFSPNDDGTVQVRDLGSRNGVILNGQRIEDATMQVSDRVVLGDVSVLLRTPAAAQAVAAPPSIEPPGRVPAAVPHRLPEPAPAAGSPVSERTTLLPRGTPEKTTLLPKPAPVSDPLPPAGPPGALPLAVSSPTPRLSVVQRLGGGLGLVPRLFTVLAVLIVVAVGLTAAGLIAVQRQTAETSGLARAELLARLLIAENRRALAAGEHFALTLRPVLGQDGVRGALLLAPDGRVLAPVERQDEVIPTLPGFGDVLAIRGVRTAATAGRFEAAGAIDAGARRLGTVWIRFDPAFAPDAGRTVPAVLGLSLLGAVGVALLGALVIFRMVRWRLASFAADVDLAIGGRSGELKETYGLPQIGRVAESVGYLIGRLRAGPAAGPPAAVSRPEAAPPGGSQAVLRLDPAFIVREATPQAASVLQTSAADLAGKHVLEAIPDPELLAVVLDCLGELAHTSGSRRLTGGAVITEVVGHRVSPDGDTELRLVAGA